MNLQEAENIEFLVVNAQHMKAVPGRKTDVKDAEWIAKLLRHGLLKARYIPDRNHCVNSFAIVEVLFKERDNRI
nr:transposase [Bacillus sp. AFS031507]